MWGWSHVGTRGWAQRAGLCFRRGMLPPEGPHLLPGLLLPPLGPTRAQPVPFPLFCSRKHWLRTGAARVRGGRSGDDAAVLIGRSLWAWSTRGAEGTGPAGLLGGVRPEPHIPSQGAVPDEDSTVLTSPPHPACVLRWAPGTQDGDMVLASEKVTVLFCSENGPSRFWGWRENGTQSWRKEP